MKTLDTHVPAVNVEPCYEEGEDHNAVHVEPCYEQGVQKKVKFILKKIRFFDFFS